MNVTWRQVPISLRRSANLGAYALLLAVPLSAMAADGLEAIRAADAIAIGNVGSVSTEYDDKGFATTIFTLHVREVARGRLAPAPVDLRIAGGPTQDGLARQYEMLQWQNVTPGVEAWVAYSADGQGRVIADGAALIVRSAKGCALTGIGHVVLSVAPWRTELRYLEVGAGPHAPVVDCAGAPPFERVVADLRALVGGGGR